MFFIRWTCTCHAAFREVGADATTNWDIVQMSSINEYWQTKDGMVTDADALTGVWCEKAISEDAEIDNDWIIIDKT